MINQTQNTQTIKSFAKEIGFDFCGIAPAKELTEDAKRLEKWLNTGQHGTMKYMENHFDLRINPSKLVPNAKSVITLVLNYFPKEKTIYPNSKIAKYAFGQDYHIVIKEKLKIFIQHLQEKIGAIHGRGFVDSAPVLERAWAKESGLGWIGKNANLIIKNQGSFYFIATLIIDISLDYDTPLTHNYCGSCTKCIDSCPTEAILPNNVIDANKCISYFTIELKDSFSENFNTDLKEWAFGCDICQDVCPWNRFSKPTQTEEFHLIPELLNITNNEWLSMNEEVFKKIFGKSALKRTKLKGMQRNIKHLVNLKKSF